ncbi:MAG: hypothetical protein A2Y80_07665 [Deltaproteobacteria bacterium RBG_13_58_19]|nr:MAG: hypothetical protein A2Y80_07665 [Deltaproteobacteria bacterium RBG_13_58_19]
MQAVGGGRLSGVGQLDLEAGGAVGGEVTIQVARVRTFFGGAAAPPDAVVRAVMAAAGAKNAP